MTKDALMTRVMVGLLVFFVCGFASHLPTAWAEGQAGSAGDGWSFTVAPYGWAAGIKGTVDTLPRFPKANIDASISDVIENTDFGFMALGEARKGRFGLLTDFIYVKLSAGGATPGPFFSGANIDVENAIGTVAGTYRLVEEEQGWLDLVAGTRVWYVNTDLTLSPGLLAGRSVSHAQAWADGIAGLRGQAKLGKGFFATGTALLGGITSEIVVDFFGGVGYAFTQRVSAVAGYRYLKVDYKQGNGDFVYDVQMHGPIVGAIFRF